MNQAYQVSALRIMTNFIWVVLLLAGCVKDDPLFPVVPEIRMENLQQIKNAQGKDSVVEIKIYYQDGDGDLGLSPTDTAYPFRYGDPFFYNLKIGYYQKENGVYKPILDPFTLDTIRISQRLPVLTPEARNKSIKGDITFRFDASPYPGVNPDTIYCEIQLFDRALNGSNMLSTGDIHLEQQ